MQWWFLGNMWPSESLRGEVKWLLHTQLARGKARFHVKLAFSRAGSSPAGHSKEMRVFLFVYFLWQPQLPQPHTRRSHTSGILLSSSPLQSVLSVFPGCSTPLVITPSLPPASQSSLAHHSAQELSPGKWGPVLNVSPTKRPFVPAGRSTQATLSSLSHTHRGFRKCQLSWLWFTFLK